MLIQAELLWNQFQFEFKFSSSVEFICKTVTTAPFTLGMLGRDFRTNLNLISQLGLVGLNLILLLELVGRLFKNI
jgi:hypothetical protein